MVHLLQGVVSFFFHLTVIGCYFNPNTPNDASFKLKVDLSLASTTHTLKIKLTSTIFSTCFQHLYPFKRTITKICIYLSSLTMICFWMFKSQNLVRFLTILASLRRRLVYIFRRKLRRNQENQVTLPRLFKLDTGKGTRGVKNWRKSGSNSTAETWTKILKFESLLQ